MGKLLGRTWVYANKVRHTSHRLTMQVGENLVKVCELLLAVFFSWGEPSDDVRGEVVPNVPFSVGSKCFRIDLIFPSVL